jgi:hypothetical protein
MIILKQSLKFLKILFLKNDKQNFWKIFETKNVNIKNVGFYVYNNFVIINIVWKRTVLHILFSFFKITIFWPQKTSKK